MKPLFFSLIAISILFLGRSCQSESTLPTIQMLDTENPVYHDEYGIYDAPPVRSFPSSPDEIQVFIENMDLRSIRDHAWDIWESINRDTAPNADFPIWETWYTGHELFEIGDEARNERHGIRDFENPLQISHDSDNSTAIPIDVAERPTSFNRFSRTTAHAIWDNEFYKKSVLDSIHSTFSQLDTPIEKREVLASQDTVDQNGFVLKPVFQFISGTEPTALPYWAGISASTTSVQERPSPNTWRQCVIIDPTDSLEIGTKHVMMCNDQLGEWEVIDINRIYNIEFDEETASNFSEFAEKQGGDDLGAHSSANSDSIAKMVQPGNIALLMAMHVTGKEISNWTWQTYWWTPRPDSPPYGHDRPSSIPDPWGNYIMRTSYFMVTPPGDKEEGMPFISYNPYLEADLKFELTVEGHKIENTIRGVFSNCMTCHRKARYPFPNKNFYSMAGHIDKGDPYIFKDYIKTDFLWSLAYRTNKKL